jgi:hypothetical protein
LLAFKGRPNGKDTNFQATGKEKGQGKGNRKIKSYGRPASPSDAPFSQIRRPFLAAGRCNTRDRCNYLHVHHHQIHQQGLIS